MNVTTETREVPWESIKLQVSQGLSWREIAENHGNVVSYGTIRRRAIELEWPRILDKRVKDQTDKIVMREAAEAAQGKAGQPVTAGVTLRNTARVDVAINPASEKAGIEALANERSRVIIENKRGAEELVTLATIGLREGIALSDPGIADLIKDALEQRAAGSGAEMDEKTVQRLVDLVTDQDKRASANLKRIDGYIRAVDHQRKVFSVDAETTDEDPWKQVLDWVTANNKPLVAVQINEGARLGNEWVPA